jgi:hypothetical protein
MNENILLAPSIQLISNHKFNHYAFVFSNIHMQSSLPFVTSLTGSGIVSNPINISATFTGYYNWCC